MWLLRDVGEREEREKGTQMAAYILFLTLRCGEGCLRQARPFSTMRSAQVVRLRSRCTRMGRGGGRKKREERWRRVCSIVHPPLGIHQGWVSDSLRGEEEAEDVLKKWPSEAGTSEARETRRESGDE